MMKKLFFWLVFLSVGMQAQNVTFADENFKALLLSSSASNTIAKNLSGSYFAIDGDGDGEISLIEAQAVGEIKLQPKMITIGSSEEPDFNELDRIMDYQGINSFTNATSITLHRIAVPSIGLNISDLNDLNSFSAIFYNSDSGNVTVSNCPSLRDLTISGISFGSPSIIPQIKNLTLSFLSVSQNNIVDILPHIENATLLESLSLSTGWNFSAEGNSAYSLNLSGHQHLKSISIGSIGLSDLDLSGCNQLSSVSITSNYSEYIPMIFGNLNVSNCPLLNQLNTNNYSNISELNASNCPALSEIKIQSRFLGNIDVNNCQSLNSIKLERSTGLSMSNVPNLKDITISRFDGTILDTTPATNLELLNLDYFNYSTSPFVNALASLKNLTVKNNAFLKNLSLNNQPISDLDVSGMSSLETLSIVVGYSFGGDPQPNFSTDFLHYLKANNCTSLKDVNLNGQSGLIEADFVNDTSLKQFVFQPAQFSGEGAIEKLNFENCTLLETIGVSFTKLNNLNIKNCTSLKNLSADKNQLENLSFDNTPNIENLYLSTNKFTALDISSLEKLKLIYFDNNNLTTFDASKNKNLEVIAMMSNPNLESLFIKNGKEQYIEEYGSAFSTTNIKYICADDSEIEEIKSNLAFAGKTANVNSYCSFTPGGNHNTISGTVRFDSNNNGCDTADNAFEFLKLKINDGTNSGETFAQNNGKYEFYTQAGNFNIAALAENPTLFTVSPANFSTNFADANNNIFTQDICVTANGNQNDAEVVIAPLTNARPGFDATYKLVWRNKGNTTLSGKVVLNYDASKMTFQNSSLPYSVASNGTLEFDYANLKPFENTASEIIFTINTPTNSINPVNSGDILAFNAQITPNSSDLTPEDNNFGFNHTVVNSFDPNDIVCLEGETIPSVAVGKYLHYVVNFENTGTAEAENIVVKMQVDPAEFDINTLQLQNASGNVETRITGDQVEFIFKKIKLQSGGHGNVLLKMRSKSDLVEGDTVNNIADIYFDYNFPIETNDYVTTINDASSMLAAKLNYTASDFSQNNYKINFDASLSTGTITNYQWEFSGNPSISSSTDVKPIVTYTVPGNYNAKLTVFDSTNASSSQSITFNVGGNVADLSTGKNSDNNFIAIDSDDDDWKGYDINGTQITPKVRQTYTGWSFADIGNGNNSQWISLNNFEGYYTYKSRDFIIPDNATDAKLNLRSLSFVRNWTYLVKVNSDGSEDETEITKTQWMTDGFKGWLNSRSPKVDNYSLSAGRYYIKVLVYSNNAAVRQSLDVNAIVSCSTGLMYSNKLVYKSPTLDVQNNKDSEVKIYPIPTKGLINIVSQEKVNTVEIYDVAGRIIQKQLYTGPSKELKININAPKGIYYLKIKTSKETSLKKIIKD